jgi:DNA repair protein RadC
MEDTRMQTDTITLRELTIRYSVKADATGQPVVIGRTVSTPAASAAALAALLQDEPGEVFAILCLSTKHRVIAYHEVSRGTLDATLVHPREVFKAALLSNAASIILTHNHPSGDPTPSPDDHQLTRRLVDAGRLIGVEVLDHIIVGDGHYFSFKEGSCL